MLQSSFSVLALLDVRAFLGRSVEPKFKADLRKSLFAHFDPAALVGGDNDDDDGVVVVVATDMTFVGDSSLGGCGGNALFVWAFCFVGDVDVLFVNGTDGGLFDFDLSIFDVPCLPVSELHRDNDGVFETELSRDDFDGVFSFSILFSGELSVESFSFLVIVLYFDIDAMFELPL